jgi:hypothetical protein
MDQPVKAGALEPQASGRLASMHEAGLVRQVTTGADAFFVLTGAGIAASRRSLGRPRRAARRRLREALR